MRGFRYACALALASLLLLPAQRADAKYAAIVVEPESGRVLFARNADTRNYPASLTKMMTLYMVFEALEDGRLRKGQRLKVSRRAAGQPASKLGLKAGETITVNDAILALIIKSANDVATVVAESLAGSESRFARKMTRKARDLGMSRTTFRNASGLPNRRQLSTARDMARLAIAIQRDFPAHYAHFSRRSFAWRGRTYRNHNKLLSRYKGTDGMKTGYIRASGFNLVASAKRDDVRLVGVVFGGRSAGSRNRHMRQLLDLGFKRASGVVRVAGVGAATSKPRFYPVPRRFRGVPVPSLQRASLSTTEIRRYLPPERVYPLPRRFRRVPLPDWRPGTGPAGTPTLAGGWSIQVGAYAGTAAAEAQLRRLSGSLPHLLKASVRDVDKVEKDGTTLYRARFIGFDEHKARSVCQALERRKLRCVALPPTEASLPGPANASHG